MFTYRELNGDYEGEIMFTEESVIVNGLNVPLESLQKIELSIGDYSGMFVGSPNYDFNPKLSTGVDNYVILTESDGSKTQIYFKLSHQNQTQELEPFIIKAMQLGHISFLSGINLLNINDYDEIQEFKKTYLKT